MAKILMSVTLKNNAGVQLGTSISTEKPTRAEAETAIAAVIQQRVDAAAGAAAELVEAQGAFAS
jgi:hypothetical protein